MLHLVPIRLLFQGSIALVALAIAAAFYSGWLDPSDGAHNVALFLRVSSGLAIALSAILVAAWRWIPRLQKFVFPYLGGRWTRLSRRLRLEMRRPGRSSDPSPTRVAGGSQALIVAAINGAGCLTLLPYQTQEVSGSTASGPQQDMRSAWVGIASAPGSAFTVYEFE
jgi:hypothetical protein